MMEADDPFSVLMTTNNAQNNIYTITPAKSLYNKL
jgi:hypothetical protein